MLTGARPSIDPCQNAAGDLRFRRQYLFGPAKPEGLDGWKCTALTSDYFLHTHPELQVCEAAAGACRGVLAGFVVDPGFPERTSQQVLQNLLGDRSDADFTRAAHSLGGRWALFLANGQTATAFNDPCGLRPIFYCAGAEARSFWCGSDPALLARFAGVQPDQALLDEFRNAGVFEDREYWWPAPLSGYEAVKRLTPNHLLHIPSGEVRRFWPRGALPLLSVEQCVAEICPLLSSQIRAMATRQPLAVTMTAGLDTRTLLSACKDIAASAWFHTWLLPSLSKSSPDVTIPRRLLERFGFNLHLLPCDQKSDAPFAAVYESNTAFAHPYWRDIASGLCRHYPQDRLSVKGNCSEVGRCFFYHDGYPKDAITTDYLLRLNRGWENSQTIRRVISEWLEEAQAIERQFGIRVLDLFYWEQRLGCWQANSQSEWDIAQETFCPFNQRKILETLLAAPEPSRLADAVHLALIRSLWPELLREPINPKPLLKRLRRGLRKQARKLYEVFR